MYTLIALCVIMASSAIDHDICSFLRDRGGRRRRFGLDKILNDTRPDETCTTPGVASHTVNDFVTAWGHRGRAACEVGQLAKRVKMDHGSHCHASISDVAVKMKSSAHNSRSMRRLVARTYTIPHLSTIKTLVHDLKNSVTKPHPSVTEIDFPVCFPHDYMAWLFNESEDLFNLRVRGGLSDAKLQEFWDIIPRDDVVWQHGFVPGDMDMVSPMVTHSDGVPVTKDAASMSMFTVSSLPSLGIGAPLDRGWLYALVPDEVVVQRVDNTPGNVTCDPLWRKYIWSMEACHAGRHPYHDADGNEFPSDHPRSTLAGEPLADGNRLAHLRTTGDMENYEKEFGMANHGAHSLCSKCRANRTTIPWNDFRDGALFKTSLYTPMDWPVHHEWLDWPTRDPQNIALDWAHTMDKGVTERFIGGVFAELVIESILHEGGTQAQQVAQLNADVQTYYEDNESTDRIHEIKKSMFLPVSVYSDVPTFSPGNMSKVRTLVGFVKEYAEKHCDHSIMRDIHRMEAASLLFHMYETVMCGPLVFSEDEADELRRQTDEFLQHYTALGNIAFEEDKMCYGTIPKCHALWHIVNDNLLNPRLFWCFQGEDFVGHIARICRSCTKNNARLKIPLLAMEKFFYGQSGKIADRLAGCVD